ncbi:hypothetical protein Bpfe_029045 [Biomphalaria pfeifferi]|uniref:Uncharacterized protein n=1 Tax=Biomphalaria pfeifferi TaxID=112525 RepID=A0AAD8EWN4_BIOPF|nr:hypothetical protein Bpfe_029045 [Biomphalaria pfeifferi]
MHRSNKRKKKRIDKLLQSKRKGQFLGSNTLLGCVPAAETIARNETSSCIQWLCVATDNNGQRGFDSTKDRRLGEAEGRESSEDEREIRDNSKSPSGHKKQNARVTCIKSKQRLCQRGSNGVREAAMVSERQQWCQRGSNGVREAAMVSERQQWCQRGSNGVREAEMVSERQQWCQRGSNGVREEAMVSERKQWCQRGSNGVREEAMVSEKKQWCQRM